MSQKKDDVIACSGGSDLQSKHPLVYLNVNSKTETKCPYCSRSFIIYERNNKRYIEASSNSDKK